MKKLLVLGLVCALSMALLGSAEAGKKKKKKPKPYVSDEVELTTGNPVYYNTGDGTGGITGTEFTQTCSIPAYTQGVDAHVFEVPQAYQKILSSVSSFGSGGVNGYDLDLYIFDEGCSSLGAFNTESADEVGVIAPGARYILLTNYVPGGPVTAHIELTAV